jgi:hypothetical protein
MESVVFVRGACLRVDRRSPAPDWRGPAAAHSRPLKRRVRSAEIDLHAVAHGSRVHGALCVLYMSEGPTYSTRTRIQLLFEAVADLLALALQARKRRRARRSRSRRGVSRALSGSCIRWPSPLDNPSPPPPHFFTEGTDVISGTVPSTHEFGWRSPHGPRTGARSASTR